MERVQENVSMILVIDDEETDRVILQRYIELAGYRVIAAANGREGIDMFSREQPDLVLVDLRLPDMDGLEILHTITTQSPNTPVIVVSGSEDMEDAIQAIRLGAWDYQAKPVDADMLNHSIGKNLERLRLLKQNAEFRRKLLKQLQKVQEDEDAGRRIQTRLLPPAQLTYGPYLIRHRVLPSMSLSGDFIDCFRIDENRVGFYFADVSGHGVSSALVTVLLKSFMVKNLDNYRNKSDTTILDPSALMGKLNKELLREELDKYITIFFGILDNSKNSLLYCNCGQFPYPILNSQYHLELIQETNMPVGMFDFAQYRNASIHLHDSFRLTIFSDGALDLLEQHGLEKKIQYLMTLEDEESVRQFLCEAEKMEERPDDISIISIEKRWPEQ